MEPRVLAMGLSSEGCVQCSHHLPGQFMIYEIQSSSKGKKHHLVMVSYFESLDGAEIAVADLMAEGLSAQDFTLLKLGNTAVHRPADSLEYIVAPFAGPESRLSDFTEGAADLESEIGGGIATTSPDDDVSSLSEMDDSESAAEDLMYPATGHSIGDEEERDVALAAKTGFFETTFPEAPHLRPAESAVEEIDLPGLGALVSEGSFGSSVLERVFKHHDTSLVWLLAKLDRGDDDVKVEFGSTGGIVAIDINVDGPNPDRIEELLTARGASWVRGL